MPATRCTTSGETCYTVPYSLADASKAQIASLTAAALKSHLKHFKLPTTESKSALVCRLFSYLQSSQADASQRDADNCSKHTSQESGTAILPLQFLDQLSPILEQAKSPQLTSSGATHTEVDAIEDDHLSAASLPIRPTSEQIRTPTQTSTVDNLNRTTVQPSPPSLLYLLFLPGSRRSEYIDFTTILPKSMFGAQEPQSQMLTLQLNPSGDNFSVQLPTITK